MLHFRLQEHGLTPGCIVSITPTRGPGRRRQWVVTKASDVAPAPASPTKVSTDLDRRPAQLPTPVATCIRPHPAPSARVTTQVVPVNGNDHPTPANDPATPPPPPGCSASKPGTKGKGNGQVAPPPASLDDLAQLMGHCLTAANKAWEQAEGVQYAPADIRAVGITLFLECGRQGIAPEKVVLGPVFVAKVLGSSDELPF